MQFKAEDYLAHFGTPRHSGRYPWGSGGDETEPQRNQRNKDFLSSVADMRKQGLSEKDIAEGMGFGTTTNLRRTITIAKTAQRQVAIGQAHRLHETGASNIAIGKEMGINESQVRALLKPGEIDKLNVLQSTANMLKEQVAEKKYIDVGKGVENQRGISKDKLATAVALLQDQGYKIHYLKVPQLGTGKDTSVKVLTAPGVEYSEVSKNRGQIQQIQDYSDDGGRSWNGGLQPPLVINSSRVQVRYGDEGGAKEDGVIYVRRNVPDVSIGKANYAQVRIAIDGTHYLKGMAVYKDDLPKGIDLQFNTNKKNTGNKLDAMKPVKGEEENPFSANIKRQIKETDSNGVTHITSAMNIVNEEGNWETWGRSLSAQMLSKQHSSLAKTQLDMTYEDKKSSLDEILKLTNPTVRKKLLLTYADSTDASAVHLHAAALPRSSWHAILPMNTLKENEIYAPNFRPGERVVLIRYPHAGTFEIPELTVNNKNREAISTIGRARDAVGINHKVAQHLSGADFDGDAVLVIPNNHNRIQTTAAIEKLKNFDPRAEYPAYEGMPKIKEHTKQVEMGKVSNLITDMTIHNAHIEEVSRAVRHSMVVIDSVNHNLNYKQSAIDMGINQLKKKYQSSTLEDKRTGASTLISRAESEARVPKRSPRPAKEGGAIDKVTGEKKFVPTGESYVKYKTRTDPMTGKKVPIEGTGKVVVKEFRSKKLAETSDAHTLSSGTVIEKIYADHSNKLKDLANAARREAVNTKPLVVSSSAKKVYAKEVASLRASLNVALQNSPRERQAQILANAALLAKRQANPDMSKEEDKKIKYLELAKARNRTGPGKRSIEISNNEWAAIQAGAISDHMLSEILNNANLEVVKKLASPRVNIVMTPTKQRRADQMLRSGYTQSDVADALGVSLSTLKSSVAREE